MTVSSFCLGIFLPNGGGIGRASRISIDRRHFLTLAIVGRPVISSPPLSD